jgi:hypothetical protein
MVLKKQENVNGYAGILKFWEIPIRSFGCSGHSQRWLRKTPAQANKKEKVTGYAEMQELRETRTFGTPATADS